MTIENKKIFILDDDEVFCTLLVKLLKELGYSDVTFFLEEDSFMEVLESNSTPDIIFMDYFLKGKNGFDLIREHKIHGIVPWLSLILMSSSDDALEDAYDEGVPAQIMSKEYLTQGDIILVLEKALDPTD